LKILERKVKFTKQKVKENFKHTYRLLFVAWIFLWNAPTVFGQNSQEDYLNSDQDKNTFDNQQWKKLKGKMQTESSGSQKANGSASDGFDPASFNAEQMEDGNGNHYEYEQEDFQGEYGEYSEDSEYDEYDYEPNQNYHAPVDPSHSNEGDYTTKSQPIDKTPPPKRRQYKKQPNESTGDFGFLKVLMWIILIGVIGFLVYHFFLRFEGNESGKKVVIDFDDTPPMEIPKTELERRLEEALSREDYREAVRIYFIFIIKDLSTKSWIRWERRKTNISYLMEMRGKSQYDLFNETVNIYDMVWYGKYTVSKDQYHDFEPKFKSLLKSINS